MHATAMTRMDWFVKNYIPREGKIRLLDVGSFNVNGCYRDLLKDYRNVEYMGLDMEEGPNVDYVPADPYNWAELEDDSFDFVISGNAFEHIEYPWLTIVEIQKKLKTGGIACILAPNTIEEHRYPTDCYRYFSDGFCALANWAKLQVVSASVSGVPFQNAGEEWYSEGFNDTLMILGKGISEEDIERYPKLLFEKRFDSSKEWERRYNYLRCLITDNNPEKTLKEFLYNKGYKRVYLYGYGTIGKIVYPYLCKIPSIELRVIDKKGGQANGEQIIKTGEYINQGSDCCILIGFLGAYISEELDNVYPNIAKYYLDDVYKE